MPALPSRTQWTQPPYLTAQSHLSFFNQNLIFKSISLLLSTAYGSHLKDNSKPSRSRNSYLTLSFVICSHPIVSASSPSLLGLHDLPVPPGAHQALSTLAICSCHPSAWSSLSSDIYIVASTTQRRRLFQFHIFRDGVLIHPPKGPTHTSGILNIFTPWKHVNVSHEVGGQQGPAREQVNRGAEGLDDCHRLPPICSAREKNTEPCCAVDGVTVI